MSLSPTPPEPRTPSPEAVLGNRVHFAPLAGIADAPVRVLARYFGAGPLMSEMVSAHGVAMNRAWLLEEQLALAPLEQPLAIQLVGSDPAIMADVARQAQDLGAASINLNMACPARKIVGGGKGAALMQDPPLAGRIMAAVRAAVTVPVTVKIRAGWSKRTINAVEFSSLSQDQGMDAVILHPRTREQSFKGKADWDLIRQVVQAVDIPVVGNGDIRTPDDARRMFDQTGCAAVMIGRGALGRPWLFARILAALADSDRVGPPAAAPEGLVPAGEPPLDVAKLEAGDRHELLRLVHLHVALSSRLKEGPIVAREVRKHVLWYSRGLPHAASFRASIHEAVDIPSLLNLVHSFFTQTD